jgi:hypothetical protein
VNEAAPSQVNANLKADTTDELLSRKRTMHMTAFKYRLGEISERLQASNPSLRLLQAPAPSIVYRICFWSGQLRSCSQDIYAVI